PLAGERHRLDGERGFFPDFAHERRAQGLADFDHAAWQRIQAVRWRAWAAYDQDFIVAEDRRTDGKVRAVGMRSSAQGTRIKARTARRQWPAAPDPRLRSGQA